MAGIKNPSMRDYLPSASQRYKERGLLGVLTGATPQEEAIAQAYSQFRQGLQPTTVNAGPLQGGYVPLEQGQQQAGQADYAGLLNQLVASGPQGLEQAKILGSMLGMGKGQGSQGSQFFGNVVYGQDEKGNLTGYLINKQTGQLEPLGLPDQKLAVPSKTVTGEGGNILTIPNINAPGQVPITTQTGRKIAATAAEAKQAGTQEAAIGMGQDLYNLVNKGAVSVGPVAGRYLDAKRSVGQLSPDEAKLLSVEENYSNLMLHALRGAQVGPKEQEMFNKSLPRHTQQKELFLRNIKTTVRNLEVLNKRMSKMRPTPEIKSPKFHKKVDFSYDPATGQFVRAK